MFSDRILRNVFRLKPYRCHDCDEREWWFGTPSPPTKVVRPFKVEYVDDTPGLSLGEQVRWRRRKRVLNVIALVVLSGLATGVMLGRCQHAPAPQVQE
jgi:hypothetical protein